MIIFQNKGLLDLRALRTFGVSAKETENPIGMFGTGLKYALAILAREGCTVELWVGMEKYDFKVVTHEVRGQEFQFITMNGEELGFTSNLGKNWELWQAFRELYCNALDETESQVTDEDTPPREGYTTIIVWGDAFVDVYRQRDEIILQGKPQWVTGGIEIYDRPSTSFFYKGVRVGGLQRAATLTYNIVGHAISLTEDRTVDWYWEPLRKIVDAIVTCQQKDLLERVVCCPVMDAFENQEINFSSATVMPSPQFMEYVETTDFREIKNFSAVQAYKTHSGKAYMPDPTPLDTVEAEVLRRATEFVVGLGFPVDEDPIIFTTDLPEQILACVYEKQIFLSRRVFMLGGTKLVASALLEEHLHLRRGYKDESRDMQTFLFNLCITLGEKLKGSPL